MTRKAFGLDAWEDRSFEGEDRLDAAQIEDEGATFRNARLWDYRPLGDTLDQLQRVRRYYDFVDVDTDRYQIEGVQRQVMLSARELALDQNPGATGFVNQHIVYTHGIGAAMVPVNEVANEGQPRLFIQNLPPVSTNGAPEITEPRIYFGERASEYIVTGARQAEFDFPTGEGEGGGDPGTETRWTGNTGIPIGSTLNRLLFALRFRDLDLMISDQITAESQLVFHRSLSDRLQRIAPFLLYDKDPYLVIDDGGRLVYVQDAYTVSDRFPHAQWFDPSTLEWHGAGFPPVQLHPQQRQDHDGRLRRDHAVLRGGSIRSDPAGVVRDLPDPLPAARPDPRGSRPARARARGAVQRPDADVRALPRDQPAAVLPERRPLDGAAVTGKHAEPAVRGLLRDHADAG